MVPSISFPSESVTWSSSASSTLSSSTVSIPISSAIDAPTTTTVIVFTTAGSNQTTTVPSGALRTEAATVSAFAQNTGAIVGVAVAAFVALLCLLFCVFFTCRRYRREKHPDDYIDGIMHLARGTSWRRPVDGDEDESYNEKAHSAQRPSGRHAHSSDMHEVSERTSHGDRLSNGDSSAESTTATMVPMSTVFGGQSYIPSLDQGHCADSAPSAVATSGLLSRTPTRTSIDAWRVPAGSYPHPNTCGTRSAVSLVLAGEPNKGTTVSSSSTEDSRRPYPKRKSLSGPRPNTSAKVRKHSSTPPTAFMGVRQSAFDCEQQTQPREQSEKVTVKGLINRLRSGRRTSVQSVDTVRGSSHGPETDQSSLPSISVFSPSLLNPPIVVAPSHPVLTFPRGVTGNSYTPSDGSVGVSGQYDNSAVLWPPPTLPSVAPSPSSTDTSSIKGYLLHPRLALGRAQSEQASITSFRDHEDYSRPINGLVNNHLRSTTTLETHATTESDPADTATS
ncbi:hypothetical protein HYPSUDRAFT_41957 [Hypholoma sublateritium FD-334 SS-4]|uniref:Transmembrane protein n=1 Tax=Hypholoma sublateritium (strain FD-334 SS-4) TaxID=945553 RepID=A0A0D2NYM1_HYPSF|nr:hypothetical protein HYPSUDRAFT_41957 [Hypholoma sublateritium FD-334 SS-4]